MYKLIKETVPNIDFIQGIPETLEDDAFFDVKKTNVLILDDVMSLASKDQMITELFTEGSHHRNLTVINLTQNVFPPGRLAVTQRRNTHYMVLFKSPMSQDQIRNLAGFMFLGKVCQFLEQYHEATSKLRGYLIIDSKQNTPDTERLKTDIFESDDFTQNQTDGVKHAYTTHAYHDEPVEEKHIKFFDMSLERLRYHAPYIRSMLNPNASPPEDWKCYLEDMMDDNLVGIDNPIALAHLAHSHEMEHGNNVSRYCEDCKDNTLRGCRFSKCPRCEQVHIYPKHGWTNQELRNCEGCQYSFHTSDNSCHHIVSFCPTCKKHGSPGPLSKNQNEAM